MVAKLKLVADDPGTNTVYLIRGWEEHVRTAGSLGENTIVQYRRALVRFFADTLVPFTELDEPHIQAWIAAQDGRGGSVTQVLKALHSLFKLAHRRGHVAADPTRYFEIKRAKNAPVEDIPRPKLEELFVAASGIDPRARPAMELMYATGARITSLISVFPGDVNRTADWLHFRVAKNFDHYGVPLGDRGRRSSAELEELLHYVPNRGARQPTLVGVRQQRVRDWMKAAGREVGLAWIHPHALRHCFGTEMASKVHSDADLRSWCALMNHKDASQFTRYAKKRDPSLRAMVEGL
ncbi:MAG: tyrosine-type recombinase/integrase [Actinomycetota bacterium]